jgi:hypothetical protein
VLHYNLYMFINCHGSGGLLDHLNIDSNPSVVAFSSCERGMISKSILSGRWNCDCSHFIYAVIRAIETNHRITNLKLAQWVDLVLEERDILLNVARCLRAHNLKKKRSKKHSKELYLIIYNVLGYCALMFQVKPNFYLISVDFSFYFSLLWFFK